MRASVRVPGRPGLREGVSFWVGRWTEAARARGWFFEPHAVAAYLGGVAAQEAVKLLTCMFVPIDNTFVYSGGLGLSAPLKL